MKYIIIVFIGYAIGYSYGHIKGYAKGYDDSKEFYTNFYKAVLNKIKGYEKERTTNVG